MKKFTVNLNVSYDDTKKLSGNALYMMDVINPVTKERMYTKFGISTQKTVYNRLRSHATLGEIGAGNIVFFKTVEECERAENILKGNLQRLSWNGSVRECTLSTPDDVLALLVKLLK